jgi:hypothetical protein
VGRGDVVDLARELFQDKGMTLTLLGDFSNGSPVKNL